ncbi:MAG: S1 RNA-binding domain-containing protein, partial [Planctomycetota bacterium]
FVDVGKKQDAMVHISQLASRYIRDARELLSIGATIRAKIVEGNSSRLALSLKDVPNEQRQDRGARRRGGSTRRRGGGRGARGSDQPTGPAGRIWRRDGAAGAATSSRRGTRRGGPRRGGRDDGRFERGERVDLRKINAQSDKLSSNPFAQFFKQDDSPPKDPKPPKKKGPKGKKADAGSGPDVAVGQGPVAPQQEPPTSGAQPQGTETPGEE